jgi:hypothetical protein
VAVGKVDAGLLLLTLARVVGWLYFLALLATVRGANANKPPPRTVANSAKNTANI